MSDLQPTMTPTDPERAARLERYMHANIPLVGQMGVKVTRADAAGIRLTAPLAPNINHERTAFGGSVASLLTLACWGYLWLELEGEAGLHIVVNEAQVSYLKPISGALDTSCVPPTAEELKKFLDTLARRGKARLSLKAEMFQDGTPAARYSGSFAVYRDAAA